MVTNEEHENIENWPVHPPFLSIREGVNKYSDDYSPNHDGLFHTDELRGFLADASDDVDIKNILALFQVVPVDFVGEDKDSRIFDYHSIKGDFIRNIVPGQKIIRIFPGGLYDNCKPCKLFRDKCDGNDKCFEEDSRIALLYHPALKEINYEKQFDLFLLKLRTIVEDYNVHSDNYLEVIDCQDNKHLYVKYHCSYSTLEEHFFPVCYSGKVIAVLMQGQRLSEDFNPDNMFTECRKKCVNIDEKFEQAIKKFTEKCFNPKKDNINPMSDKRLKAIVFRINRLENRIKDVIEANAQKYVTTQFLGIEKTFRDRINEIDETKFNALEQFKQKLNIALQNIFDTFNKEGFIRIYAIRRRIEHADPNTDEFDLIGDSSKSNVVFSKYPLLIFRKIHDKRKGKNKGELLKDMVYPLQGFIQSKDIFRMDVPFSPQTAYIIWKRDNNWKDKYGDQYELYRIAVKSMYHSLLEPYFILNGIKLEEQLEISMRVTGHEAAQVIPAVINTINTTETLKILETNEDYQDIIIKKPVNKILDASLRLMLLENLFRRSRLIFKSDPDKEDWDWYDFHRIIYATSSLFQEKVQYQNIQYIDIKLPLEMSKYKLETHYGYLSHILFNLVDNAVKYGFRGTNIEINIKEEYIPVIQNVFEKKCIDKIIISVINYGSYIKEEEREKLFDLFYRSGDSLTIEGMGIGLFLVRRLCNLMKYQVECKPSVKVDNYNIAVKYHYTKQHPKFAEDPNLKPEIIRLLNQNISDENMRIINTSKKVIWEIGHGELKSLIFLPVYRNEFQITIPIKYIEETRRVIEKDDKTHYKSTMIEYTTVYDHLKKY